MSVDRRSARSSLREAAFFSFLAAAAIVVPWRFPADKWTWQIVAGTVGLVSIALAANFAITAQSQYQATIERLIGFVNEEREFAATFDPGQELVTRVLTEGALGVKGAWDVERDFLNHGVQHPDGMLPRDPEKATRDLRQLWDSKGGTLREVVKSKRDAFERMRTLAAARGYETSAWKQYADLLPQPVSAEGTNEPVFPDDYPPQ